MEVVRSRDALLAGCMRALEWERSSSRLESTAQRTGKFKGQLRVDRFAISRTAITKPKYESKFVDIVAAASWQDRRSADFYDAAAR